MEIKQYSTELQQLTCDHLHFIANCNGPYPHLLIFHLLNLIKKEKTRATIAENEALYTSWMCRWPISHNSAASYFSFPGATGYTPARWAMLGFAKSLQADLYHTDFKVSMIVFGKVDSPYFKNNPVSEERIPKIANWLTPTMSVASSGKVISRVVRNKKTIVIRPLMMSLFVFLNRLVPGMFTWLMRITSYK